MAIKKAVHGGGLWRKINQNFNNFEKIIDADVNDAFYPPSPKVISKIKTLSSKVNHTPDTYNQRPIEFLSKLKKIPKQNISVGSGSSDLFYNFILTHFKKTDKAVLTDPTYSEYEKILRVIGSGITKLKLQEKNNFEINMEELLTRIPKNTKLLVICNPNSPAGTFLTKKQINFLMKNISKKIFVLIDEAYIEYLETDESAERLSLKYPNLIVLKTLSKSYALAGLRVAYCISNKKTIEKIEAITPPWSVSLLAQEAMVQALKDKAYYLKRIRESLNLKKSFIKKIGKLDKIKVFPSHTNYFLIKLLNPELTAKSVVNKLYKKNILVRDCSSFSKSLKDRFIRITVRNRKSNNKIFAELKKILSNP